MLSLIEIIHGSAGKSVGEALVIPAPVLLFMSQASGKIFKDVLNGFLDICVIYYYGIVEGLYQYRSVCPLVRIGSVPLPQASVSPRNQWEGRGQQKNTQLRVRGRTGPIRTTGEKA
jgi:hypothetical protein